MCSPLEQAGKERERVKEREKGEPYTCIPDILHLTTKKAPGLHTEALRWIPGHRFEAHKATASCPWSSIQCCALGDLKNDSKGDSTSESRSPSTLSEPPPTRLGRDPGARKEDTTRGIRGGEAEESLDPGTLAKIKRC